MRRFHTLAALCIWETLLTLGALLLAILLREQLKLDILRGTFERSSALWMLPVVGGIWIFLLAWACPNTRGARLTREWSKVLGVVAVGTAALLATAYAVKAFDTSRALIALFAGFDTVALGLNRAMVCYLSRYYHKSGYDRAYVLVVGTGAEAHDHGARLLEDSATGIDVVGYVSTGSEPPSVAPDKILGTIEHLYDLLKSRVIDEVHFAVPLQELARLNSALSECADLGIRSRICVGFLDGLATQLVLEQLAERPVLTLSARHHQEVWLLLKRVFDIAVSLAFLLVTLPLSILVGLGILITSGAPLFYKHRRIGMNGRPFKLYKFRTMVVGADRSDNREYYGPFVKVREDDDRITAFGKFLRTTSLDELPQLINVLKGDMSLVGPRPLVDDEVRQLEQWQRRRLRMRPGITGLWQAQGRSELSADERLRLDTEYVDRWSILLDAKILLRTVPSVLSRKGAR